MKPIDLNSLRAFTVVARERSFTRAAAQLGVSQSALSHAMRALESRVGIRLLARTTRGVAPTEAGERLLTSIAPHYQGIDDGLSALGDLREKPAGTLRISAHDHPADTILLPALARLLPDYPAITVEVNINYGLTDIIAERFDAGVRIGDQVAQDMIAVRISAPIAMAVVATPAYLARRGTPATPQDLQAHDCINLRLPTHGGLYAWEFVEHGQPLAVQVRGPCIFNTTPHMLRVALAGLGLAYVPRDLVLEHVAAGRLQQVLAAYSPEFPPYHLYFPSRRQSSPAFVLLIEALRYRA